MDAQRSKFLTSMIDILDRLHETSVQRGEPLLASVLAIAKGEAEDALRHADELAALVAMREEMSSRTSWRAADQEPPAYAEPEPLYADEGDEAPAYAAHDDHEIAA